MPNFPSLFDSDGFDIPFSPLSLSICHHVCARQVQNEVWNLFPKCFFWKGQTTTPLHETKGIL